MTKARLAVLVLAGTACAAALVAPVRSQSAQSETAPPAGVREAAWSPDSKRIVVSRFDALWTMAPDGKDPKRLIAKPGSWIAERDPEWSRDGKSIAFSADTDGQFDIWMVPAAGGAPTRVTTARGDERWPSWTTDGRIVYSHREPKGPWRLYVTAANGSESPTALPRPFADDAAEWQARVSPDGTRIVFLSNRDLRPNDDTDVWVRTLGGETTREVRITNGDGPEAYPVWAPDNARVAYAATRNDQSGVYVSIVPTDTLPNTNGRGGGRGRGAGAPAAPTSTEQLASRHRGVPAWSPDSQTLAIATFPVVTAAYNGNPNRNDDDAPIAIAGADQYQLWRIAAPRAIDEGATALTLAAPDSARWASGFDQVWQTLKTLYYQTGPSATAWDALRQKYRAQALQAKDVNALEDVIDQMIHEQPLIKPALESSRGVVASGSALASAAGAEILAKGGNVVDAGIAVSLALGVVEPDATSLGGDGQAILFLNGMTEPVIIEYKDMTPGHATPDNPKIFTPNGGRTAPDGPTVANIPGVAAGLDLLYQKYASKKIAWADLVAPAIKLADEGFVLDEALPTSIAEGRASFSKYPEAAKVFMPNGRVPRPGDRFVNKDYAETLRLIAKEGARSFYSGTLAQKIVADMAANGGIITADDLAQYRAMERKPLVGRYRNHLVYSVAPPVSTGAQLIETLQILDNYQPKPGATYTTDADYLHNVIEAWRVRDGGGRIADPERWPVDLGNHLEAAHALERFKLIDPKKVYNAPAGGRGSAFASGYGETSGFAYGGTGAGPIDLPEAGRRVQSGTTAFVVADGQGNMIAFTQTLSTWGGNYYVSKGLGFLYNDHFRGGRGGGGYGSMLPLMRSNSTSVPTLVFAPSGADGGRYGIPGYTPLLAVGCAGNAWIPASVYDIILNVVDGRMDGQHAIEAPRMLIGGGGGARTQIEDRFPRALLADLEARGHSFAKVGRKGEVMYGYAAAAVVNAAKGTVSAGAEPRRSHGSASPGG